MRNTPKNLPGTLWKSNGAWHWRVALPGEKRRDMVLTMPFSGARIPDAADRSLAESAAWRLWERQAKKQAPDGRPAFTTNELVDRWTAYAREYYRERECASVTCGLRSFRALYGSRPMESLTHADMLKYRDAMLAEGLARATINKRLGYVKRMVTWGLDELIVSAQTKAELTQISNLKPGRSSAREPEPITAAPAEAVEAALKFMPPSLADMVRVHRLTGMRPAEMCALRWQDVARGEGVWIYRPEHHKNEWRRQPRVVVVGPRAQAILAAYDGNAPFVFSPALAMRERYEEMRARRKTKVQPSQIDRSSADAIRHPGERWEVCAYARAVRRACELAGIAPWSPNQLRHSCATEVRRQFGIMAAHAVLGHSAGPRITDRYSFEAAEDEAVKSATPAMLALG